jgi:asparagine synthase (glutamine-hydrolysing)
MCGIAGVLALSGDLDARTLTAMGDAIAHRGPDHSGQWVDLHAGVGLAHRRLAIVDVSPAGEQPMRSFCGRYVMVFNGEVYNHLALRHELSSGEIAWRGRSDTETLLGGFSTWGIERTLERSVGMFAIALWDRQDSVLHLIRDRFGEKPLYYGWQSGTLLFGSELKALRVHPRFSADVDRVALQSMLKLGHVPSSCSIYTGISKVPPGSIVSIPWHSGNRVAGNARISTYWRVADVAERCAADPFVGDDRVAVDRLEALLVDAVALQSEADVPLGAFLSGGIDSSMIVALLQRASTRAVKTFTIGFSEAQYNEAQHGKEMAAHLGTSHAELLVTAREAIAVACELPHVYDEPFADASQIPTLLVSRLARRHVTVSLSGDAGDELFGGYGRYIYASRVERARSRLPSGLRRMLAQSAASISPASWDKSGEWLGRLAGRKHGKPQLGAKIGRLGYMLGASSPSDVYARAVSRWPGAPPVVLGASDSASVLSPEQTAQFNASRPIEQSMMIADSLGYLPDGILVKLDRASMGASLESRVPFLDHRVAEFAWRLPLTLKLRDGQGKWLLRQVLQRYVPLDLIERPKMGFSVPIGDWLRGPMRDWAEDLLDERRMRGEGFLNPRPILTMWRAHLDKSADLSEPLWSVLMFQAWLRMQRATPLRDA